jgi:peptide/nickel transport system substrate-binding protein
LPTADSFVAPSDPGFDPDVRKYPYDPAAARRLLDEAGFEPGPDGVRIDGKGRRLAFGLATTSGNRARELIEQELQAKWRAIGVAVTLANDSAAILLGQRLAHGAFDLALYSWNNPPENPPTYTLLSASIPQPSNDFVGGNYPRFANAEIDRLTARLMLELDPAKRTPIWAQLQEIYARELPALPLYFESNFYVIPTWLKGIDPAGHVGNTTLWVEEWRAE